MPLQNLLTATFHVTTYSKTTPKRKQGFEFPKQLFALFGFKRHSPVALIITRLSGEVVYCGVSQFTSGTEITQAATCRKLKFGEQILVTASRAPGHHP
jgi:hypothetical protein